MPDDVVTVWVLKIVTRYGADSYMFRERAVAREQLFRYVEDNWDKSLPRVDMPADRDEAIKQYFEGYEGESYVLAEDEILEEPV
jgi:hypothetical protein